MELLHCPTSDRLKAFLCDTLPLSVREEIDLHLQACPRCLEHIALLTDDRVAAVWRELLRTDTPRDDQSVTERLRARWPDSHQFAEAFDTGSGRSENESIRFPGPQTGDSPLGSLGPYHLLEELGSGGMGIVYKARDTDLGRNVALKVLRPELAVSHEARLRFEQESRAAASIRHPNVVTVLSVGRVEGFSLPFLTMELVVGVSLAERIRRAGPLAPTKASEIALQATQGLAFAHRAGLIHRDVKPSNILIEHDGGQIKVADFGIARIVQSSEDGDVDRITRTGQPLGSPPYMSPEQISAKSSIDARSDVYGVGVVLFEMLTGRPPFLGSPEQILQKVLHDEPLSLRRINHQIPRDLETITLKCLAKDPDRRYQSADDLAQELRRWLEGKPILARPIDPWERILKWARRSPASALLAVFVVVAISCLLASWGIFTSQLSADRNQARLDLAAALDRERLTNTEKLVLVQKADREKQEFNDNASQRDRMRAAGTLVRQGRYSEATSALAGVPVNRRGWEWNWLSKVTANPPRPIEVIGTHEWGIAAAILSKDGRTAITSGQDGRVISWDMVSSSSFEWEKGVESKEHRAYQHARLPLKDSSMKSPAADCFPSLCWIGDETQFVGASLNGRGIVWDTSTRKRSTVLVHERPLFAVAASRDGRTLIFGDDQGTIIRCNLGGLHTKRLRLSKHAITKILALPTGHSLVGQANGSISVIDQEISKVLCYVNVNGRVWDLDYDAKSELLFVACDGTTVPSFAFDPSGHRLTKTETFDLPEDQAEGARASHSVRLSSDGERLAIGDDVGRLIVWDRRTRKPRFVELDQRKGPLDDVSIAALDLPLQKRISAVVFTPNGDAVLTAGQDTALRQWSFGQIPGPKQFQTVASAKAVFDATAPNLVWIGGGDGSLSLWDCQSETRLKHILAHQGTITGIARIEKDSLVVTCGSDQTIRFWSRSSERILSQQTKIDHDSPFRSLAVSPDGQCVAAYDASDRVTLWNVTTRKKIAEASCRMKDCPVALSGRLAFNADGSQLAALGPEQTFWLFSGKTLSVIDKPYVVAGKGGTSIVWHPGHPSHAVAGDTLGRLGLLNPIAGADSDLPLRKRSSVSGLAFSPNGDRLAAAFDRDGVFVLDQVHGGWLLQIENDHPSPGEVSFDPKGEKILLVHQDGFVKVWDASPRSPAVSILTSKLTTKRAWSEKTLYSDHRSSDLYFRTSSTALDSHDRLLIVYSRRGQNVKTQDSQDVVLGHEEDNTFKEELLDSLAALNDGGRRSIYRSMVVGTFRDQVVAGYRRPAEGTLGEFRVFRGQIESIGLGIDRLVLRRPGKLLFEPSNSGFDASLFVSASHDLRMTHFSHSQHYLQVASERQEIRDLKTIGRQGDGYNHRAAEGSDGRLHLVFMPFRFDQDPSSFVYTEAGDGKEREIIDRSIDSRPVSFGLDEKNRPVVLYWSGRATDRPELKLARKTERGWIRSSFGELNNSEISNMVIAGNSNLQFVYWDSRNGKLVLVRDHGNHWGSEIVWENDLLKWFVGHYVNVHLAIHLDSQKRPVIVVSGDLVGESWLKVFRLDGNQ